MIIILSHLTYIMLPEIRIEFSQVGFIPSSSFSIIRFSFLSLSENSGFRDRNKEYWISDECVSWMNRAEQSSPWKQIFIQEYRGFNFMIIQSSSSSRSLFSSQWCHGIIAITDDRSRGLISVHGDDEEITSSSSSRWWSSSWRSSWWWEQICILEFTMMKRHSRTRRVLCQSLDLRTIRETKIDPSSSSSSRVVDLGDHHYFPGLFHARFSRGDSWFLVLDVHPFGFRTRDDHSHHSD